MGLDMYIKAKLYTSKYSNKDLNEKLWKLAPFKPIDNIDSAEISFEVGYWRKANAIHGWFVDYCQDGNDNCKEYEVSREQLEELKELCKQTLTQVAEADKKKVKVKVGFKDGKDYFEDIEVYDVDEPKLTPKSGFFFGTYELDEWYVEYIKQTIEIIDRCLSLPEEYDFYYQSSW